MRNHTLWNGLAVIFAILVSGCASEDDSRTSEPLSVDVTQPKGEAISKPLELSVELAQRIERGRDLSRAEELIGAKAQPVTEELRLELIDKGLLADGPAKENLYVWYTENVIIEVEVDSENRVNRVGAFGMSEEIVSPGEDGSSGDSAPPENRQP